MAGGSIYVYRKPPRRRSRRLVLKAGPQSHPIFYDVGIAAESIGGAIRRDAAIQIESVPAPIKFDIGIPGEALTTAEREDLQLPTEWSGLSRPSYDVVAALEQASLTRSDWSQTLEWGGSVTAIFYDAGIGAELVGLVAAFETASVETIISSKPVFYDLGLQLQALSNSQQDVSEPIEYPSVPVAPPTPVFAPSGFGRLPTYTDADFQLGMQNLLPTGPVWPRDADAQQTQIIGALTKTYTRNAARATNLLSDAFPTEPVELLPEWELSLGLPDPCAGVLPTIQQRQQQVAARFIAGSGQSIAYFVNYAATLGYTITITQFSPSRFGKPFGLPFGGAAWAFAWQVNAPTFTVERFAFGHDAFGEPFTSSGNTVLQCELQRLAPAHTTVTFSYS